MKFCFRCGAKILEGSRFCVECGVALSGHSAEKQAAAAAVPVSPVPVPEVNAEPICEDSNTVVFELSSPEKQSDPIPIPSEPETVMFAAPVPVQEPQKEPEQKEPEETVFAVAPVPAAAPEQMKPEATVCAESAPVAPAQKDPDATVFAAAPVPVAASKQTDPDATVFAAAPVPQPQRKAEPADPDATVFAVPAAAPQSVPPVQQRPAPAPQPRPAPQPAKRPGPASQPNQAPTVQQKPAPQPEAAKRKTSDAQKAAAKKNQKKSGAKRYEPLGAGRKFLAVLLCILIFFLSFVTVITLSVRLAFAPETMAATTQALVQKLDLSSISAVDLVPDAGEDVSLADWIAEQIEVYYSGYIKVDGRDVEDYLERSALLRSIGEIIGYFVQDLLTGSHHAVLDGSEIREILEEDSALAEELFGIPMDQEDIETLASAIESSGMLEKLDADQIRSASPAVGYALQYTFSYWAIGGLCLLIVVLSILLGLTNRGNMIRTFGDLGITETVLGGMLSVSVLLSLLLTDYVAAMLGSEVIGVMARFVLEKCAFPFLIVLGLGVLLLLISGICRAVHNSAVRKAAKAG